MDKMTSKKSDIYGNMTRILQKNPGFDGQFSLIDTFRAGFGGDSRRRSLPVARRAPRIFRQHGFCSAGFQPAFEPPRWRRYESPITLAFLRLQSSAGSSIFMRARSAILFLEQRRWH
jgi:hypothetical protein